MRNRLVVLRKISSFLCDSRHSLRFEIILNASKFVHQFLEMEKHLIPHDLPVFGIQVTHFPEGIGESFDQLIKMISGKFDRGYYGISFMDPNGKMVYFATALEKEPGEAKNHNCH